MADRTNWPRCIRPSGAGFRIRIKHRGAEYGETIKGTSKASLAAAVKRRDEILARIAAGLQINDDLPLTLEEAATEYLSTLEGRRSTIEEYWRILNFWSPLFSRPVSSIRERDIRLVMAEWNVGRKTKKNRLNPLFGAMKHAGVSPPHIRLQKEQKAQVDRYSPAERDAVLDKLEGQALVYFSLLFGTGLRPGEALALDWSDYDGEQLLVSKSISKRRLVPTKTYKVRRVYVPQWVRPILNKHTTRFAGRHIFTNTHGGPYLDTDMFNGAWKSAHRRARVPYRIPYVCRHTRAAELLSAGVQPAAAAQQLGHSTEMFLRVYSEFMEEYSNADMSRLEGVPIERGRGA